MKIARRHFLRTTIAAAVLPAVPPIAAAQAYPNRPIRILVGFPAGGVNDIYARLFARWLSERMGQSFIVENRAGLPAPLPSMLSPARREMATPFSYRLGTMPTTS
jgi:hypothetical protein